MASNPPDDLPALEPNVPVDVVVSAPAAITEKAASRSVPVLPERGEVFTADKMGTCVIPSILQWMYVSNREFALRIQWRWLVLVRP